MVACRNKAPTQRRHPQHTGGFVLNTHTCCSVFPAAGIRLAGATNDVHVFDVRTGTWCKITPMGEPPSPRAAHAAAAVGAMVVVQVRAAC